MSELYEAHVGDHRISTKDGLPVYVNVGTPITIDGTPHVRLSHGTIVPAAGWHADRQEALREAAARIETYASALLLQAYRLRTGVLDG